jgi:GTP-sensing pleiotropic transcriptional regulator CodY
MEPQSKKEEQMNIIEKLKKDEGKRKESGAVEINSQTIKYSEMDVIAYIAHRIPGIYGTCTRVIIPIPSFLDL